MSFRIGDLSNPQPAKPADGEVDLTSFAALTTQVDAPAMSDMLRHTPTSATSSCSGPGPHQPNPDAADSTTVRFRSLDGRDREIAVPRLTFTEPITTLAGAASWPPNLTSTSPQAAHPSS